MMARTHLVLSLLLALLFIERLPDLLWFLFGALLPDIDDSLEEEDLSGNEKAEMKSLLATIEVEKKALERLQADQNMAIAKFNQLLEDTKQRLGIK